MIVVLGRPLVIDSPVGQRPAGLAARIALAAAAAGGRVELAGSVGDDEAADAVALGLARAGVGHAALQRIPAAVTPREGSVPGLPRMDARDVDLALRYLTDFRVLVVADALPAELEAVVLDAAGYTGATIVVVVSSGGRIGPALADAATVLEAPEDALGPFAELVGRYAAGLDAGTAPAEAFAAATRSAGWEPAG
jgi:hypothetical protein